MATTELNQFLENIDEKVLECTICFTRLQDPKSLNCTHTFCLMCLEEWVKVKGKLTCPTCSKSYPIPEGGLQKLPPNTVINNLLETIKQLSEKDQRKCVCKKGKVEYYCQECTQYLCSACSDHHKDFKLFANHKLHSVEVVQSIQKSFEHPPQCSIHNKPFEFYCTICKIPICVNCTMDHKEWEGKHKLIKITEAFQKFKETSATLEEDARQCHKKLQDCLKVFIQNGTKFEQNKDKCLKDIDMHVQVITRKIEVNGEEIKTEVEKIYKAIRKENDKQMDELKATITDINTKLSVLNHLLKSDEATAMQSSETVITALKDRINVLPKTDPNDREMKFHENRDFLSKQCDIGHISHPYMKAENCCTLKKEESMSQDQAIAVNMTKTDEAEIHANQPKEDETGNYFVTGTCTSPSACKLDVSTDGKEIKQSPMIDKIEEKGLVNTIEVSDFVDDVIKCEDDCLLVSCRKNEILKYKQSGEYIGTVTLPQGVRVNRMFKMKNGNIAFCDVGNKCIKVCNVDGQVVKSIALEIITSPSGIYVDEAANGVYVGDWFSDFVCMFDFDNDTMKKKIGSETNKLGQICRVCDVTLTNQGYLLILYYRNQTPKLFDKEGNLLKVFVEAGDNNGKVKVPRGVVIDKDDNIIISSEHKLQLFSRDGNFIKRIDKPEDGINYPYGVCIISHHPRRVAVANNGDRSVKIFNY